MQSEKTCIVRGCKETPVARCWESGLGDEAEWVCQKHVHVCERNPAHKLCPRDWKQRHEVHLPYCEGHYRFRGKLKTHKIIGEGAQWVYVYYYPTQLELAKHKRENTWSCKIGFTTREELDYRIFEQGALIQQPEVPVIALAFRTDEGARLEATLHKTLAYAGRQIKRGKANDCFRTNPREIVNLYRGLFRLAAKLQATEKRNGPMRTDG